MPLRPASQPPAAAGSATLFEGARLITGDEAPPIEDSAFVVQDGKFTSVGRRGEVQAPEGAARVDLTGKTVMPGIIEAHAHLGYWKDLRPSAENFTRENLLSDLQRFAYHGVTAVLSMGADRREIAWPLRDEFRANPRPDAAMYLSAGGFAMPKGGPFSPLGEAVVRVVTNEEDVRREIQELVAKKADFIKVWQDSRRELMPRPVIEFLIAEAHRNNLRVVAHTHALSDFKHLLRSGVDAFAHPTWRQTEVEPVDDELIALFKAHPNVPVMTSMWTPRHEIYGARPVLDRRSAAWRDVHAGRDQGVGESKDAPRRASDVGDRPRDRAVCRGSKRRASGSRSGPTWAEAFHVNMTLPRPISDGARTSRWRAWSRPV